MTPPIWRRRGRPGRNAVASPAGTPPAVTFATIDFETATSSRDSACALGAVVVEDGQIVAREGWLIRPPGNTYDSFNTNLHGIGPQDTEGAPGFGAVWDQAMELLEGKHLWAHSAAFDMSVLRHSAAGDSYELPSPVAYGCTYMIAKTTWPNRWSYSLATLANDLGISLNHHDPVSDAEACRPPSPARHRGPRRAGSRLADRLMRAPPGRRAHRPELRPLLDAPRAGWRLPTAPRGSRPARRHRICRTASRQEDRIHRNHVACPPRGRGGSGTSRSHGDRQRLPVHRPTWSAAKPTSPSSAKTDSPARLAKRPSLRPTAAESKSSTRPRSGNCSVRIDG